MNSWGIMESASTKPPQDGLQDSYEPVVFHSTIESCYLPSPRLERFSRDLSSIVGRAKARRLGMRIPVNVSCR